MVGEVFGGGAESNMFTNMPQDEIKKWLALNNYKVKFQMLITTMAFLPKCRTTNALQSPWNVSFFGKSKTSNSKSKHDLEESSAKYKIIIDG